MTTEATTMRRHNHGPNVKRWREWRGMKQDVLAEQIGISQSTLSAYEKRDQLEPEILEKFSAALDIPVEAITELNNGTAINIFSGPWHDNSIGLNQVFNPIEKIVELYEEKTALYERILKERDSIIELLQDIVKDKK